jgi:hypothetical protein
MTSACVMVLVPFISAALALSAVSAVAQSRPQSPRMTCAQAAGMVFQRGAIVLGTWSAPLQPDRLITDD